MTRKKATIAGPHPDTKKALQRAGWDMLWHVADEYEWRGGLVSPAQNSATGVYSPLAYVEIATDLARVGNGSERIEDWVDAYGMMDWGSMRNVSSCKSATAESRMSLRIW